mgnify:CR=1 FL=1
MAYKERRAKRLCEMCRKVIVETGAVRCLACADKHKKKKRENEKKRRDAGVCIVCREDRGDILVKGGKREARCMSCQKKNRELHRKWISDNEPSKKALLQQNEAGQLALTLYDRTGYTTINPDYWVVEVGIDGTVVIFCAICGRPYKDDGPPPTRCSACR